MTGETRVVSASRVVNAAAEPLDDGTTRVTHSCDWTSLTGARRFERARSTTSELKASVDRLAALVEG